LNDRRKNQLWNIDYDTPFQIGLTVFISMPSAASGKWGGVAGIQRLIGARAFRKLEREETQRIHDLVNSFKLKSGAIVAFQKNAWNALRSEKDRKYSIDLAKKGMLKGTFNEMAKIPIYGVPPTRLVGPCRDRLKTFLMPEDLQTENNLE